MHCGYLSLRHNCNTNCRNMSLMITETSTTLSRPRSMKKFFLLPLFLSPRLTGEEASPLAPRIGLSRSELFISPHPAVKLPHARLMLGLLSLPTLFLLLLLLLLLQLEDLGQEEGDGGAVNAVGARQRRHHQERSFPRGVPHGAVTPLRPGSLRQRCRPPPPGGGVFCPRRALCGTYSTSSSALLASFWLRVAPFAVCTLPDEWCITVARAAAIDCCSCRHHERSRRCLRR